MSFVKAVRTALAVAVIGLGAATGASAATLVFLGGVTPPPPGQQITYDADTQRGQLTCSLGCEGLLSNLPSGIYSPGVPSDATADGWSASAADLFNLANSSDATELAFVNLFADPDFASGTKSVNNPALTFTSSAEFILFKIGSDPNVALIKNTFADNVFTYTPFAGQGAGLSHYTEFGQNDAAPVPLPAGLPLLIAGLGALGIIAARRRPPNQSACPRNDKGRPSVALFACGADGELPLEYRHARALQVFTRGCGCCTRSVTIGASDPWRGCSGFSGLR